MRRWQLAVIALLAVACAVGLWSSRPPREVLLPPPPGTAPGAGVGLAVPVAVPPGQSLEIQNAGSAPVRIAVEWQGGRYVTRREVPPGWRVVLHLRVPPGVVYVSPVGPGGQEGGMTVGLRYAVSIAGGGG